MRQFLLFILILFLTLFSSAQELHVVKDNINCSYGIKDKSGNWVIEPTYILIQQYSTGYFLVKDIEGDGVLNPSGKWIIPCKYDRIETTNGKWRFNSYINELFSREINTFFRCYEDTNLHLITTQGVEIARMHSHDDIEFDGGDHLLIYSSYPQTSTYVDTSGNILIDKKPGVILPFEGREYSLLGDGKGNYDKIISGNGRLINRTGEVILKESFERARIISNDRIAYEIDGNYGVMTISGTIIIPPDYRAQTDLYAPEQLGGSWTIFDKKDRAGRMRSNGTIMINPLYDDIKPIYLSNTASKEKWQVSLNGKIGLIDSTSRLILPIEYDRITTVMARMDIDSPFTENYLVEKTGKFAYLTQSNAYRATQFYDSLLMKGSYPYCTGFITKKNGSYGMLNPDGTVRADCVYAAHFRRKYDSDKEFFSNGKNASQFTFTNDTIYEMKWLPYITDGAINFYTDSTRYWAFLYSKTKNALVGFDEEYGSYDINNHLFMIQPKYPRKWIIYSRKTKRRLPINNISDIYRIQGDLYQIRTRNGNVGVMNNKGTILLDTIYKAIAVNQRASHIWAAKPVNQYNSKWVLLDSNGRQVLSNLFDEKFEVNTGDQIASQNNRTGLIDSETLRWKIRPNYSCFFRSIGDYYAILSDQNKKGIIRSDGKLILEPIYDSIVLLTSNCYSNGNCAQGLSPEIRWWVLRGSTEMIVDQDGKQTTSAKMIHAFYESLFFEDTLLIEEIDQLRVFPVLDYTPSLHFLRGLTPEQIRRKRAALWKNSLLKRSVFDTIMVLWKTRMDPPQSINGVYGYSIIWGANQQSEKEQKLRADCNCARSTYYRESSNVTFRLESIGSKYVSMGHYHQSMNYYGWDMGYSQQSTAPTLVSNFVMKNGKAVSIQLADIFPVDSILMQEFVIALQKRDDLNLQCSSLEAMIEMIGGKFSLSESGVRLYLNQQSLNSWGSYSPVELLIPVENLSNHTESKWLVPILLNE